MSVVEAWWAGRDSNPQALRHQILSLTCLPISPLARSCWRRRQFYGIPARKVKEAIGRRGVARKLRRAGAFIPVACPILSEW